MTVEVLGSAIHLETEAEAWMLLQKLIEGGASVPMIPKVTFGEWAKIDVYIPAKKYDSAITPYMMQGWVELQRSIYRTYSLALGRSGRARSLTEEEKGNLELVVEVKSGSSDQTVDVQEIIQTFVTTVADKMEPLHILIVSIAVALTYGGTSVINTWLAGRKEVKLAEIEALKNKAVIDGHVSALNTIAAVARMDVDRAQLLAKAAAEVPLVQQVAAESSRGREALIKHVTKEDAVVNGVPISAEAGRCLTSRTRLASEDYRADGLYKIRKVDTTVATGFRVHLVDPAGTELVADVAEVMTTKEDREVIRSAEWEKVPVFLQINAKQRRGEILDAKIMRARPYDPDTDGVWS